MTDLLVEGQDYEVSAWVMLKDTSNDIAKIGIEMVDDGVRTYTNSENFAVNSQTWYVTP